MAIRREMATSKGIKWEKAPTELTRRHIFMQIYGETGTGRTSSALTAPGPIALMHSAEKIDGVVEPFARDKQVKLYNFGGIFKGKPEAIAGQAKEKLDAFKEAWEDAFTWARTIILDTHTELWELVRLARFGTTTPKGNSIAFLYAPVNAEMRSILKQFREQDSKNGVGVNVIAIGQIRERYRNDKPTGIMEPAGMKEVPYYSDITVRTFKKKGVFGCEIEKAWANGVVEGMELGGDMSNFPTIMSLITEMEEKEWDR